MSKLLDAVIQNLIFETFNVDIPTQGTCFLILEIFCSTKGVSYAEIPYVFQMRNSIFYGTFFLLNIL